MNSNDLRVQINAALKQEEQTHSTAKQLTQHIANTGVSMTLAQQQECLNFIKAYISETPDIMDAAFSAATQAGARDQVQPVLDVAFNYWAEPQDYISDSLGLIGLTDDAYLTRMFLEAVSGLHAQRSGRALLSIDLGPPNRIMRYLIGEPVATTLDAAVGQTVASQFIQAGLQQLTALGGLNLNMPGYSNYMSQYEMDQQIDVQLGAMGIF